MTAKSMEMNVDQMLATGGVSGVVLAVVAGVYMLCKNKRSRCQSNCTTGDSAPSPTQVTPATTEIKPSVVVT